MSDKDHREAVRKLVEEYTNDKEFSQQFEDDELDILWKQKYRRVKAFQQATFEDFKEIIPQALARGLKPEVDDTAPAAKRQRVDKPSDLDEDNFKTPAPSSCDDETFDRHQKKGRFLNFRPARNSPKLPAALVHPCFGEFLDTFNNQDYILTADHYRMAVEFCVAMCENFSSEEERQAAVKQTLEKLADASVRSSKGPSESRIIGFCGTRGVEPDLLIAHENEELDPLYASMLAEVKKELGSKGVPADRQGMLYHRFFWKHREDTPMRQNSACPCLLLVVVGNIFCVYALAYGSKVSMVPLTPFLHAISLRRYDKRQMEAVVRCFMALDKALKDMQAYVSLLNDMGRTVAAAHYIQLADSVWEGGQPKPGCIPREITWRSLPWRISNPQFEVQRIPGYDSKHVYVVTYGQEKRVFKYTQSYGHPVHEALSQHGLAPTLIHSVPLPGQWWEIQMEYLPPGLGWRTLAACTDEDLSMSDKHRLKHAVLDALKDVHAIDCAKKVALGDCRNVNVMVRGFDGSSHEDEVRFLDFDWSGYEGDAKYPAHLNFQDIHWPQGVDAGTNILQEHDVSLLTSYMPW